MGVLGVLAPIFCIMLLGAALRASHIMTQLMGADDVLAASIIVTSTVLSFPALSIARLAT